MYARLPKATPLAMFFFCFVLFLSHSLLCSCHLLLFRRVVAEYRSSDPEQTALACPHQQLRTPRNDAKGNTCEGLPLPLSTRLLRGAGGDGAHDSVLTYTGFGSRIRAVCVFFSLDECGVYRWKYRVYGARLMRSA